MRGGTSRHRRDLRRAARAPSPDRRRGDGAAGGRRRSTRRYGLLTFGAQFAEVAVDPELGARPGPAAWSARSPPGACSTPKLARSQLMGGMLWGLGQALLEGNRDGPAPRPLGRLATSASTWSPSTPTRPTSSDRARRGRRPAASNPLGVKGVGEIGQVGVAAAIANAVFNATGRRVRELPLAAELVMDPRPPPPGIDAAPSGRDRRCSRRSGSRAHARGPGGVAFGAGFGSLEPSLLVLGPLVDLRAAGDRDGRLLVGGLAGHDAARARCSGLRRHAARRGRRVVLTIAGQALVAHVDLRGIVRPGTPPAVDAPTFPATMALAGAMFVAMLQLHARRREGGPLRRLRASPAGCRARRVVPGAALGLYELVVRGGLFASDESDRSWSASARCRSTFYVVLRGWPFTADQVPSGTVGHRQLRRDRRRLPRLRGALRPRPPARHRRGGGRRWWRPA